MKTMKLFGAIALAVATFVMTACGPKSAQNVDAESTINAAVVAPEGVVKLADDNMFRPDKKVPYVTVLDFNATWCIPCKKLTPAYDKAAQDFKGEIAFYSVDFQELPETAKAFEIESVPTVVILTPDGKMTKCVGLGDFATEEQVSTLSADELTDVIYANLVKML